jgi:folate-binding protein YgfZ
MTSPVRLDHRAVILVNGSDAEAFLQGLLTQDVLGLAPGGRRYGALLTPQGKVIADMILERSAEGFLIDCDRAVSQSLLKRLRLFKLRAAVTIEEAANVSVTAFEGTPDPRAPSAPMRRYGPSSSAASNDLAAYHAARIAAGLAEQGVDFGSEEVFPTDIDMDLIGGVDFRKGCFVGQEVVSRMKRRGTTRRRTLKVALPEGAPSLPAPILAGADGFEIGTLTSAAGHPAMGLARVRIDRMQEAVAAGQAITAGGRPVVVDTPPWLAGELGALSRGV